MPCLINISIHATTQWRLENWPLFSGYFAFQSTPLHSGDGKQKGFGGLRLISIHATTQWRRFKIPVIIIRDNFNPRHYTVATWSAGGSGGYIRNFNPCHYTVATLASMITTVKSLYFNPRHYTVATLNLITYQEAHKKFQSTPLHSGDFIKSHL